MPGYLLSLVLLKDQIWTERLPTAFVLGIGLATPYTLLAIFQHMRLNHYVGLSMLVLGLVLFIFLWDQSRSASADEKQVVSQSEKPRIEYGQAFLIILLVIIVSLLAFISSQWPYAGDDLAGLPFFAEILRLEEITGTEPFHGTGTPVTPRNELIVWGYQNVLVNKIGGTSSVDALRNNRPIFVILSFLAFFMLLRRFFGKGHLALFILSLWGLYLLTTLQEDGMGSNLVTRIIQDKFVGWFIVVPVVMVLVLWVLEHGRLNHVIALVFAALGATLLHPITLSTILLLSSSFGLFYMLFESSKKAVFRTFLVGLVLLFCLLIPIYQYIRYTNPMPIDLSGIRDAVEYGRLTMAVSRYRLWLLDNDQYILHPAIVLQPVVLIGLALTLLVIPRLHQSNAARLLVGANIFLLIFLYYPPLTMLIGQFVTPYLLWRLAWPIPALAVFAIGWVGWALAGWLARLFRKFGTSLSRRLHYLFSFALFGVALLLSLPQIRVGMVSLLERYRNENFTTCSQAQTGLDYLDQLTQTQAANVLASRTLNFCIPGRAALANVVEFRGYGTINRLETAAIEDSLQRVTDVNYFSSAKQVDDLVVEMLKRWEIDYIVVETDRVEFNFSLGQLEGLFEQVYTDATITLYAVARPVPELAVVNGFAAFRQRQWDMAEMYFDQARQEDQQQALATLGLAMVSEAQGDLKQALDLILMAVQSEPRAPALYYQLAGTYLLLYDAENAVYAYQQAVSLAPELPTLQAALGLAYKIADQSELALATYSEAARLQAVEGSAAYYTLLGDLLGSAGWYSEAAPSYRQAIALNPSASLYTKLAQVLEKLGDWQAAIEADQQAISLERWASAPRVHLGNVYLEMGQEVDAIRELNRAWELNPTNVSTAVSLASALQEVEEVDNAIKHIQQLVALNRLMPGPHRALEILYRANGDVEAALRELDASLVIQLTDASIIATYGELARETEAYPEAENYFEQALLLNPSLPSAKMGLSYLYGVAAEYGPQRGQYFSLARAYPAAAWPHYLLAAHYKNRGSLDLATDEILWALTLEPLNASGYVLLGDIYDSQGEYLQAVEQYQTAITLEPESLEAYLNLSAVYIQLEQFDQAQTALTNALEQVDDIAAVQIALGDLSLFMNDLTTAQKHYEEALAFDDRQLDAYTGLSRLYSLKNDSQAARQVLQTAIEKVQDNFLPYQALADFEMASNNPQAALEWLESGVQANPEAAGNYVSIGDEYRLLGQPGKAIEWYQQALTIDDRNLPAYLNLAGIYENLNDYETAEEIYNTLLERVPYSTAGYLGLGNLYVETGKLEQAEEIYREALIQLPLSPGLYLALSNLYILQGDWEQAAAIRERGYQELPTSSEAAFYLATIYRQMGKYENAQRIYEEAITINPAVPGYYLGLSQLALASGEIDTARQWLELAMVSNPRSAEACLNLASFHEIQGDANMAESYFQQAVGLAPSSNATYAALGQFLARQNRYDEALQVLQAGLVVLPLKSSYYTALGDVYVAAQQPEEAISWYQAAMALNDGDVAPYLAISRYYQNRLEWQQAADSLQAALLKQPGQASVHMALGNIYKKMGLLTQAADEFQQACALDAFRTDCRLSLGDFYATSRQWEQAIEQYQVAIQLDPTELSTYSTLARIFIAAGRVSQATQVFSLIIENNPDQSQAWLARAAYFARRQNWEQAFLNYEIAWQRFPDEQEVGRQMARYYQQRGDWEAARSILDVLLAYPEVEAATYVAVGDLEAQRAHWQAASEAYQQAIWLDPTLAAYSGLAQVSLLQGRLEDALLIYQSAVLALPEDPQAYLALGDMYLTRLDYAAAQQAYEQASALSESFNTSAFAKLDNLSLQQNGTGIDLIPFENYVRLYPTASNYAAVAYRFQVRMEWQAALDWYQQALELDPYDGSIWLALGNYYRARQDWQPALEALEQTVYYSPSQSAYLALGAVQEMLLQPEDAFQSFQLALEMDRSSTVGYIALANWYVSNGQSDQAVDLLQESIQVAPGNASSYEALGKFYLSQGQVDQAMDAYQAGLDLIPGAASLYVGKAGYMGDQLAEMRDAVILAEALQAYAEVNYDRAVGNNNPANLDAKENQLREAEALLVYARSKYNSVLTTYEVLVQDFDLAESYYQQALAIQPSNVFALVGLGDLYADFDQLDAAITTYEQAVALNPNSVMALNALGNAYLASGQLDLAQRIFEQALQYSPNNLGTFYGLLKLHLDLGDPNARNSAATVHYSQHWWVYYITRFRESEAARLAQLAQRAGK
ncbi:MAG: tetratricopeptide repeat protein [Anaerolineales bacterium]|nr:tetratricopeptide repeat protein [Anaerolineales bacterium]